MKQIVVIGGGASGLAAALSAAKSGPGASVTVLEALDRVGKKILATGNGRCNLTNRFIEPVRYHSTSSGPLRQLLSAMPTERSLDFFRELGLLCAQEEEGRIYPYCRQASMVLDVLLLALQRRNVQVLCNFRVESVKEKNGAFLIRGEDGRTQRADAVILATGGKAAPKLGGLDTGYGLAAPFGHESTKLYPCLTALNCAEPLLKGLKGIRIPCEASLWMGGKRRGMERGEVQFAEYGLSGIPAMQLSCLLKEPKGARVLLDLFPDQSRQELRAFLEERLRVGGEASLEQVFLGNVNKRVLYALMKSCGIAPLSRRGDSLTAEELDRLTEAMKAWTFTVTSVQGWDQAQVTGGGIPLEDVDEDFQSRYRPGLYLTGELLDAVGDCGGYNLHWAWCSGVIAGEAAARAGCGG